MENKNKNNNEKENILHLNTLSQEWKTKIKMIMKRENNLHPLHLLNNLTVENEF